MWNVHHSVMDLKGWYSAGGAVLKGWGTLRGWSYLMAGFRSKEPGLVPRPLSASWLLIQCDQAFYIPPVPTLPWYIISLCYTSIRDLKLFPSGPSTFDLWCRKLTFWAMQNNRKKNISKETPKHIQVGQKFWNCWKLNNGYYLSGYDGPSR